MYAHYFYWQFVAGPLWLLQFYFTVQQALWRLFSVSIMLRTLFAPWRRDRLAYTGSVQAIIQAWSLNQISRLIGFIIRASTLMIWVMAETAVALIGIVAVVAFWLAPLLLLGFAGYGIALVVG